MPNPWRCMQGTSTLLHGPCMHPDSAPSAQQTPAPCSAVGDSARGALLVANLLFVAPQGQGWPLPRGTVSNKCATAGAGSSAWRAGSCASLAARGCSCAAVRGSGRWLCFQLSNPQRAPIFHFVSLAAGVAARLTARGTASPASRDTAARFPARCGTWARALQP